MPPVLVEDFEGAVTYLLIVTVDFHILLFIYLQFSDCVVYICSFCSVYLAEVKCMGNSLFNIRLGRQTQMF